jgi:hypothetical protein
MKKKITGFVFYEGPSRIDGKNIIGIVTIGTSNQKTGNLAQTWILRPDISPLDAVNTGEDKSICGTCPLRGLIRPASERLTKGVINTPTVNKGRSCYVLLNTAPFAVWKAYNKGLYPKLENKYAKYLYGIGLRYGAYGDPVAIPRKSWTLLEKLCTGKSRPGYTHQWKENKFSSWKDKIMASTHSIEENELAKSKGWRTFRTIYSLSDMNTNEKICPASPEGEFKLNCSICGACNGKKSELDSRKSIAILAHGTQGKVNLLNKVINS